MFKITLAVVLTIFSIISSTRGSLDDDKPLGHKKPCDLSEELIEEIHSYQPVVNKIMDYAINGKFKGRSYNDLGKHF